MPTRLLPVIPPGLVVDQVLPTPDGVTILASPSQERSPCPACSHLFRHAHTQYHRTLGNLPWQGRPVTLHLRARRFRCFNPTCSQQTFAECLPGTAPTAARRTERLGSLQRHLGVTLGGEACKRSAMPANPDTLPQPKGKAGRNTELPLPQVIAIGDWAWCQGCRYRTVIVALERDIVLHLLPDRQADTLATWLRQQTSIKVVARDRAGAHADGAVQVADRRHLLRNLDDIQALVGRQHAAIRLVAKQIGKQAAMSIAAIITGAPDSAQPTTAARRHQASYTWRQARYEDKARLPAAGAFISRFATQFGADCKTVRCWLRWPCTAVAPPASGERSRAVSRSSRTALD